MKTKTERAEIPAEAPLDCQLCPRLVAYRGQNAQTDPGWFNAPVPGFGDKAADLLIVGLAPGRTGANRTGRPFTGDWAGDLLYATLDEFGLSSGRYAADPDDGLRLHRTMITNAVKCAPPENKPTGPEINTCRPFLLARLQALTNLTVIITLGKISHDSTIRALGGKPARHPFGHNAHACLETNTTGRPLHVVSSYHCSRYNTNTGRLTKEMFQDVFRKACDLRDQAKI